MKPKKSLAPALRKQDLFCDCDPAVLLAVMLASGPLLHACCLPKVGGKMDHKSVIQSIPFTCYLLSLRL